MSLKRTYDIGNGVTIEDDGYYLRATAKSKDGLGSTSIGVKRPPLGPPLKAGDEVEIQYSVGRRYFYLPKFATPHGFWLGTKAWPTQAECEAQQKPGIFGKSGCEFTKPSTGETWYREKLDFAYWKVETEREAAKIAVDDMVIDYLHLAQQDDREGERRFNEVIAPSGRSLNWVMERIGAWVAPEEVPTVVLA